MNRYDTQHQQLILVNEKDEVTGSLPKMAVHEQGLLHRAFSVMLYRRKAEENPEFLLQQRHPHKYHCGGLWTNTCCGHPGENENTRAAATRRLYEETSIQISLKGIGQFQYHALFDNGLIEHELDHVFIAEYGATPANFNRAEIINMAWMPLDQLTHALQNTPHLYTPWLAEVVKITSSFIQSHIL